MTLKMLQNRWFMVINLQGSKNLKGWVQFRELHTNNPLLAIWFYCYAQMQYKLSAECDCCCMLAPSGCNSHMMLRQIFIVSLVTLFM